MTMPSLDDLRHGMVAIRITQRGIATASDVQKDRWRHELVAQRRILADQIAALVKATDALPPLPAASNALAAFRRSLSHLRGTLAEHQATWPAVSVDPAAEEHRASVRGVRAAFDRLDLAFTALERSRIT